jgi:hypothetical protein
MRRSRKENGIMRMGIVGWKRRWDDGNVFNVPKKT